MKFLDIKYKAPRLSQKNKSTVKENTPKTAGAIIKELQSSLEKVKAHHLKKDLEAASTLLLAFKGRVWKIRKHKGIKKSIAMSMMSSIDVTLKKWKKKDATYTTKQIAEKIKHLKATKGDLK